MGVRHIPFILGVGLMLAELVTRKRRDTKALRRWAQQNEKTVMRVESCLSPKLAQSRSTTNYIVRYQDKDGDVHESVFEVGMFGTVELLKTEKLSRSLARGMQDVTKPMDCRKCGSRIRSGLKLCPYCRAERDIFKFC